MFTPETVDLLDLGIRPVNAKVCMIVESALLWVLKNTTLTFDISDTDDLMALPANVRLFVLKYYEIMNIRTGITSESISNLSQSFDTTDKSTLIWQAAEELLTDELKSRCSFVTAQKRWK